MKILIADDDRIILKLLLGVLSDWGYQVVTAANGTEALRALQEPEAPPLIILDWSMPGLDGLELCRRLRQQQTPTPPYIILLTAHSSKVDVVIGLQAGANDFMTKPFDLNELRARVQVGSNVVKLQNNVARRMREFEEYVEVAPLGILVVEHDGIIGFANSRACSIFGYESGELVGLPIERLVPLSLQEHHVALRNNYIENPGNRLMAGRELFGRRKDNSLVPVAVGLNAIRQESSVRVVSTVMDLTVLRRAEEQLQRFFDLSLDLFCIAHVDGSLFRVNANYSRLLGYSNEELLSRPFYEIVNPEDVSAVEAQVQRLAAGQSVIEFRCRLRDKQGKDHWIEWNAQFAPDKATFYAVGRNITERLRLENELLYREKRERAILDNTPAIIYVKGTDGRYEFVNRRHAELFSGNQQDAVGKFARDFFSPEVTARIEQHERHIIETRETITVEEIARQEDGEHTYVIVKFPLLDPCGRVTATAGISTDITEQVRARLSEQELALARSFQSKLYPKTSPEILGIDVAGSAIPLTQMCGDYYDYIKLGPKRLLVTVGDVSGHGVGPAMQMSEVRCTIRILARMGHDLPSIMGDLNRMLCEDLPESTFVSFFLVDIDVENHRLCYLGAGHDAFLIRADGTECSLKSTHPLLGIDSSVSYWDVASIEIDKGDVLFLFTDGLNEARSAGGEEFGRKRAVEIVGRFREESANRILRELFLAVYEFTSGRNLKDDVTAVLVKIVE